MKNYIIGFLSCALIIVCAFAFWKPAQADVPEPVNLPPNAIGWIESEPDYTGLDIEKVVSGPIIIGYLGGNPEMPISRPGIAIYFNTMPDMAQLDQLDLEMNNRGLSRNGGGTVAQTLANQQEQITTLTEAINSEPSSKNPLRELIENWKNK